MGSGFGTVPEARERKIKPGTTLLREWHGVQHRLTVLEDGVQFGGERYRSLSEVARKITFVKKCKISNGVEVVICSGMSNFNDADVAKLELH